MSIDASTVGMAFEVLLGRTISEAEAAELATTLDSREELLAYLLTRTDFLKHHPDVKVELQRVASQYGLEAETRRSTTGPSAAMKELSEALREEALKFAADGASTDAASRIDELVHHLHRTGYRLASRPGFSPERWIKP